MENASAGGAAAAYTTHLPAGTVLCGRYSIRGELGSGSFGITYLADDAILQIPVAIKEYFPSEHSTRAVGRSAVTVLSGEHTGFFVSGKDKFLQEARILAKFQNEPGIVRIFNTFEENGTAYIVMEYLEGETLERYLERNKTLDEDTAVSLLMPLMKSLETVHRAGIIHRDISPDNIFLTMDGSARLIDFGASRYAAGSTSLTVIVKPGFSAEEQYRSLGDQGPHTDVYALAATLYRMITGQNPPDAVMRRAGIEKNRRDLLAEPHTLNKNISAVRENAILNALNVDIRDRTPDISSFLSELNAEKPAARRYGRIRRTSRFSIPLWLKIAVPAVVAVSLVMIILLASGVISFSRFSQNRSKPEGAVEVPEVEGMEKDRAVSAIQKEKLRAGTDGTAVSEYIPAGQIVLQTPSGGSYLFPGDEVLLTVSRGEGVVKPANGIATVPYVTWASLTEAAAMLREAGLSEPEIVKEHSDVVKKDCIISQSVEYGEKVDEGSTVVLVVSLGEKNGSSDAASDGAAAADPSEEDGNSGYSQQDETPGTSSEQPSGNPEDEGIQILSVRPDHSPESMDEKLRMFIETAYDLETADAGKIRIYIRSGDEFVLAAEKPVERGDGGWTLDIPDQSVEAVMEYPVLAVLEDSEGNRLAEDEYDFNLLTYLDPTLVPGDGMDFVDMQLSGRTLTVSLIYDDLKESYLVNRPGAVPYSMDLMFGVHLYDGFKGSMIASYHIAGGEEEKTITLSELEHAFSMDRDTGGGYEPLIDVQPAFFVEGTKMSWAIELPEEIFIENLSITGWEIVTPEETMYFFSDVADGIHRIRNEEEDGGNENQPETETPDIVKAEKAPDGDYARITAVDPAEVTPGEEVFYNLTIEYSIDSSDLGEICIGMNTEDDSGFMIYNRAIVERGSGHLQLGARMKAATGWPASLHVILSPYPHDGHWDPITGDIKEYGMDGSPENE